MMDLKFELRWFDDLQEWRVIGSNGTYCGAKSLGKISEAVFNMVSCEARSLQSFIEHNSP